MLFIIGAIQYMAVAAVAAVIIVALTYSLYRFVRWLTAESDPRIIPLTVFFTVLLAIAGTVGFGIAEEVTEPEGLRAQVVEVDLEAKIVTVETEDGELYQYKATGKIDAFRVRISLDAEKVVRVEAETKVKATLIGFDIAHETFKLLTAEGDIEEFYLEEGSYSIDDAYYIYYADGFAPICRKRG